MHNTALRSLWLGLMIFLRSATLSLKDKRATVHNEDNLFLHRLDTGDMGAGVYECGCLRRQRGDGPLLIVVLLLEYKRFSLIS